MYVLLKGLVVVEKLYGFDFKWVCVKLVLMMIMIFFSCDWRILNKFLLRWCSLGIIFIFFVYLWFGWDRMIILFGWFKIFFVKYNGIILFYCKGKGIFLFLGGLNVFRYDIFLFLFLSIFIRFLFFLEFMVMDRL